jgi:formylglycine-generating enzyme required for sulfatase activity
VYWSGDEVESLQGVANLSDSYGRTHGHEDWPSWEARLDDGQTKHAQIGTYRANSFGLHDVHGNVWEWCLDGWVPYSVPVRVGDGYRESALPTQQMIRGGSFATIAHLARAAKRFPEDAGRRGNAVGVRPAADLRVR